MRMTMEKKKEDDKTEQGVVTVISADASDAEMTAFLKILNDGS